MCKTVYTYHEYHDYVVPSPYLPHLSYVYALRKRPCLSTSQSVSYLLQVTVVHLSSLPRSSYQLQDYASLLNDVDVDGPYASLPPSSQVDCLSLHDSYDEFYPITTDRRYALVPTRQCVQTHDRICQPLDVLIHGCVYNRLMIMILCSSSQKDRDGHLFIFFVWEVRL